MITARQRSFLKNKMPKSAEVALGRSSDGNERCGGSAEDGDPAADGSV